MELFTFYFFYYEKFAILTEHLDWLYAATCIILQNHYDHVLVWERKCVPKAWKVSKS